MRAAARLAALVVASIPLSGCLVAADVMTGVTEARGENFAPADYAWSMKPGANSIEGLGVSDRTTRAPGPCTGEVFLLPDGFYVRYHQSWDFERFVEPEVRRTRGLTYDAPHLPAVAAGLIRRARCDAGGRFAFTGLPDGTWWLYVPTGERSIHMYKRVSLSGGHAARVEVRRTCVDLPRPMLGDKVVVCGVDPVRPRPPADDPNFSHGVNIPYNPHIGRH
jgi:hypothetical protein